MTVDMYARHDICKLFIRYFEVSKTNYCSRALAVVKTIRMSAGLLFIITSAMKGEERYDDDSLELTSTIM